MSKRDDEEIWFEFFSWLAFFNYRWNHFIWTWLTQDHLFARFSFSKNIISLKSLGLITDHVSINSDFCSISSGFDNNCNKLRYSITLRMFYLILLLISRYFPDFLTCKESIMVDGSEDPSTFLKTKCFSYHISFNFPWVFKRFYSIDLAYLTGLIQSLNIYTNSLWVVWVF